MPRGPRPVPLSLSAADREVLERLARRPKTAQALALRARIVLACAELPVRTQRQIAEELGVHRATVGIWRKRYAERGADGLLDEPRPGAPRTITDEAIEHVLTLTLESEPADATHWSTRGMARASGMSQSSISRIWRAFGLQPHRSETFKLSRDPLFIEKVRGPRRTLSRSAGPGTGALRR